jgi:hypothetical protein
MTCPYGGRIRPHEERAITTDDSINAILGAEMAVPAQDLASNISQTEEQQEEGNA